MQSLPDNPIATRLLAVIEAHAKLGERALCNEAYAELLQVSVSAQNVALKSLLKSGLIEQQTNGRQQRRFFANRVAAWTGISIREFHAKPKAPRKKRPCLCCGETFQSEGAHNRLCSPCKDRDGPPQSPERIASNRHYQASRLTLSPSQPACHGSNHAP